MSNYLEEKKNDIIANYKSYNWYCKGSKCAAFIGVVDLEHEGFKVGDVLRAGSLTLKVESKKNSPLGKVVAVVDMTFFSQHDDANILHNMLYQDTQNYLSTVASQQTTPDPLLFIEKNGFYTNMPASDFVAAFEAIGADDGAMI